MLIGHMIGQWAMMAQAIHTTMYSPKKEYMFLDFTDDFEENVISRINLNFFMPPFLFCANDSFLFLAIIESCSWCAKSSLI